MKILFINHEFFPIGGGASNAAKYIAEGLVRSGYQVHVVTPMYQGLKNHEVVNKVHIHRIWALRKHRERASIPDMLSFIFSAVFYCRTFIRNEHPDIIQTFNVVPSGAVAYVLNKLYKIPYIVCLQGSDVPGIDKERFGWIYPVATPFIKIIWRNSAFTTAVSSGLKVHAKAVDNNHEFIVIPNGVDIKKFKSAKTKKSRKIFKILAVGRVIQRKGFQDILQALPQVMKGADRKIQLDIIGSGPYLQVLQELIGKHKLEHVVKFHGLVEYNDIINHYGSSDVFVNASYGEGMSLAILEAMSSGLPIIASDAPGNEELVKPGLNGFLFPKGDITALAKAVLRVLNDNKLRQKMAKNSLNYAKKYSWDNIAKAYANLYKKIRKVK